MQEVIMFYNRLEVSTRQILDSNGAIPTKTVVDAKVAIQEIVEYSQKWQNRTSRARTALGFYRKNNANPLYQERRKSMKESFMNESAKRHEEKSNLIKEIRASADTVIGNQGASIKTLEIQIGRDQVDDLMPTIEEGEVVDKPIIDDVKTGNDNKMVSKNTRYPSNYDEDEKIRTDYAYNLKFSCMIEDELGNFANVPVFIGKFYVVTDFKVVKDMDPYLDEGIREVVVREPFCEISCMETRRFHGIITIHNKDDSVTYQMARANPRFKHLTNEQCNKILPLLKVSEQDRMNGISHPYPKLKGFYKGVLNLEPDFIRDPKWKNGSHAST
uniref:Homeodomain-like protein n=1 Tax=Tanacetum cinerariifolium TaxID=118510 RepID=A0A699GWJ8_TANCI|nr:homeodomain-like protein [Tanacetum cinerariifolium]